MEEEARPRDDRFFRTVVLAPTPTAPASVPSPDIARMTCRAEECEPYGQNGGGLPWRTLDQGQSGEKGSHRPTAHLVAQP